MWETGTGESTVSAKPAEELKNLLSTHGQQDRRIPKQLLQKGCERLELVNPVSAKPAEEFKDLLTHGQN